MVVGDGGGKLKEKNGNAVFKSFMYHLVPFKMELMLYRHKGEAMVVNLIKHAVLG
jgi:hypothetical protein